MRTVTLHRVPTGQIEVGDVVHSDGITTRIDSIRAYPNDGANRDRYPVVYACLGTVLNLDEVVAARIAPRSFFYDGERDNLGPGHGREDSWNVQGNDLATWTIARAIPAEASHDVPGPVSARLDGQGRLEPGDEGYWRVWGAHPRDIRPGDLVMSGWKDRDDPSVIRHAEYEVAEMASFGAPTMNTIRVGFITTAGQFASVGMLQPMKLLRWGTGNYLGDYVR